MARRRSFEVKMVFELERASERALVLAYHCVEPVVRRAFVRPSPSKNTQETPMVADEIRERRQRQVGS